MCDSEYIKLVYSILIGAFLAYIAYQQMKINKNKLKLDLYNKRFDIYKDTLRFYQELIGLAVSKEAHVNFINSKEASYYLFSKDRDIYELLDAMHSESFKIIGFKEHGKELSGSPNEFIEMNDNSQKVLSWFNESMPLLKEKMSKYLNQ